MGGSAWGPLVTATQMFGGVLYSCGLQTCSDVCTHVCAGEGAGTSLNVCACLAPTGVCVHALGLQLTWEILPTEVWGWLS